MVYVDDSTLWFFICDCIYSGLRTMAIRLLSAVTIIPVISVVLTLLELSELLELFGSSDF